MRTTSSLMGAVAALLLLLCAGCASGPTVRVDKDPGVDLHHYKTFAFFEAPAREAPLPALPALPAPPFGNPAAHYTTLQTQHLQRATREQMEKQGYVYDAVHPDLLVNAVLHVGEKFELRSTAGGHGYLGLAGGVESNFYREGTLSIDLVDARRNALVWQGVAEGRIDQQAGKDPGPAIEAAVTEIFAGFPDVKGK